jgi:hypothetical protein
MTITSRYAGKCASCGGRIHPGDRIEWQKGQGSRHITCQVGPTLTTPPRQDRTVQITEPGVYENNEGIFIVKRARESGNLYAKKLVEINADRLTEDGDVVQIEFEYAKGAIFNIKPEHKMDFEKAKALSIRYGKCINCGRRLKAAVSVELGIGPVCRKSFR